MLRINLLFLISYLILNYLSQFFEEYIIIFTMINVAMTVFILNSGIVVSIEIIKYVFIFQLIFTGKMGLLMKV